MDPKDYKKNGYFLEEIGLVDSIKNIRNRCIEVFNQAAILHDLPEVKNDEDVIDLYHSKHRDVWVAAYDQLRFLPEVMELCGKPEVINAAKNAGIQFPSQCLHPMLRVDMPSDDQFLFYQHQDYVYNLGSQNSITVWMPLQDIDKEIGQLGVLPGSHRGGHKACDEKGILLKYDRSKETKVPVKVGQALVFSQFLEHESGKNRSNKIRFAFQIRFNDLAEKDYAMRNYYLNKTTSTKSLKVDFKTYFPD